MKRITFLLITLAFPSYICPQPITNNFGDCKTVKVTSSDGAASRQKIRLGSFQKENYLENGKFVFKHKDRDQFLYLLDNGNWVIGSVVGKDWAGLYTPDCKGSNPPLSKDCKWKYSDNGWKRDDTIKLECKA